MNSDNYPTIYVSLQYLNCTQAIDWLINTLGFTLHMIHKGEGDRIIHAELQFGNGIVMVSSTSKDGLNWQGEKPGNSDVSLVARNRDHVEKLYETVKATNGKMVKEIQETDFGQYGSSYGFTCSDIEDNRWSVGTYQPMDRISM